MSGQVAEQGNRQGKEAGPYSVSDVHLSWQPHPMLFCSRCVRLVTGLRRGCRYRKVCSRGQGIAHELVRSRLAPPLTPPHPPPPPSPCPAHSGRPHTQPAPPSSAGQSSAARSAAHPVGVEGGTADQIRLPPGIAHHQVGWRVADDDQPVPGAGGPLHRAAVDVVAGDWDAAGDLLLDQPEVSVLHQLGGDAGVGWRGPGAGQWRRWCRRSAPPPPGRRRRRWSLGGFRAIWPPGAWRS